MGDHQGNESAERVDVAASSPRLPFRPLLGHPGPRPDVNVGVGALGQPQHGQPRLPVELLALLLGDEQPRPEPVGLGLGAVRLAVLLAVDPPAHDSRLACLRSGRPVLDAEDPDVLDATSSVHSAASTVLAAM